MYFLVVIAIALWLFVINVVNPPTQITVRSVPVKLLNEDYLESSNLAIAGEGIYTVDVDLSGKRTDLMVKSSDLTATADLNGLTPGQNYITVRVTAPSGTTVEQIRLLRAKESIERENGAEKAAARAAAAKPRRGAREEKPRYADFDPEEMMNRAIERSFAASAARMAEGENEKP